MNQWMKKGAVLLSLCMALCGCTLKQEEKKVRIASGADAQSQLMSELIGLLLEKEGAQPQIIEVAEGTKSIEPAMEAGEFDLYFENTGKAWSYVLKENAPYNKNDFEDLLKAYEEKGLTWKGMQDFQLSETLAVRKDLADQLNLKALSDLKKEGKNLVLGTEKDFLEREDGFALLKDNYGITFGKTKILSPDLLYMQLKDGKVDLIPISVADGRLLARKMVALEDNLKIMPQSRIGFVVRMDSLQADPAIQKALDALEGKLHLPDFQKLNQRVSNDGIDPKEAAREFLTQIGLLS